MTDNEERSIAYRAQLKESIRAAAREAWNDGYSEGMRREFEVMACIKAGEPTPEAKANPHL